MTYKEFTEMLLQEVQSALFPGKTAQLHTLLKNNDTEKTCILIQSTNESVTPVIYLEDYYQHYRQTTDHAEQASVLQAIVADILQIAQDQPKNPLPFSPQDLNDFAQCKSNICCRLISSADNQKLLAHTPHLVHHDLCIVFYLYVELMPDQDGSILLQEKEFQAFHTTPDELYPLALENTMRLFPPQLETMGKILGSLTEQLPPMPPLSPYILTNESQYYGAACILYPNLLSSVAKALNNDFYLIPSSVHEWLILPYSPTIDSEYVNSVICNINASEVDPDEILGNHCYFFDRNKGEMLSLKS